MCQASSQHSARRPARTAIRYTYSYTRPQEHENTSRAAAIDVGANNTLAIVTSTGETSVYHARPEFKRFQRYSGQIARLQLGLPENRYSSQRIQRLHDKRTRKHNHSRNAAVKHICEWLLEQNVDTVYVGDLSDVLDTHWSAMVNEKTYAFWSHGQLVERIELTLGDTGITIHEISEEDSSSQCPECDSKGVQRSADEFHCHECESEAHRTWLERGTDCSHRKGSMTRSAALRAGRHRDASQSGDDEGAE